MKAFSPIELVSILYKSYVEKYFTETFNKVVILKIPANTVNKIHATLENGLFKNEIDIMLCYEHFIHVEHVYNYIKIYMSPDNMYAYVIINRDAMNQLQYVYNCIPYDVKDCVERFMQNTHSNFVDYVI